MEQKKMLTFFLKKINAEGALAAQQRGSDHRRSLG